MQHNLAASAVLNVREQTREMQIQKSPCLHGWDQRAPSLVNGCRTWVHRRATKSQLLKANNFSREWHCMPSKSTLFNLNDVHTLYMCTQRAYCAHPHSLLRSPNRAPSALAMLSARCTRCRLLRSRSTSLPFNAIRQRQHGRKARADRENSLLAFSRLLAQSHRVRSPHPPPRTDRPHVSLAVALMRRMPLPV